MVIQIVLGLVLLFFGGEALVRGAVQVARRLNVSPLLIGLTLVGFGTSVPELITSLDAAWLGSPGIAIGNVVGSNIANIALILGLAALIAPLAISRTLLWRDGSVMGLAALAALAALMAGVLGRNAGIAMLVCLAAYVGWAWLMERRAAPSRPQPLGAAPVGTAVAGQGPEMAGSASAGLVPAGAIGGFLALLGLAMVLLGARMLVHSAIDLSETLGLSQTVVGLSIVAVGTSLPELATSVIAAWRRQPDIAIGNIVGSNIFNIFGILGVTAILKPLAVPAEIIVFDIWVMLGATVALLAVGFVWGQVSRGLGLALLTGYGVYVTALYLG